MQQKYRRASVWFGLAIGMELLALWLQWLSLQPLDLFAAIAGICLLFPFVHEVLR